MASDTGAVCGTDLNSSPADSLYVENTQCLDTQQLDGATQPLDIDDDDFDVAVDDFDIDNDKCWAYLVPASPAARLRYPPVTEICSEGFDEGNSTTLGRKGTNNIKLKEPHVSGLHCSIFRQRDASSQSDSIFWVKDHSTNGTHISSSHNNYQERKIGKVACPKTPKTPRGKKPGRVQIYDGDELIIIPSKTRNKCHEKISFYFYRNMPRQGQINKKYDLRHELGRGAFATVRLGIQRLTGDAFAVKIIQKKKFNEKRHNTKRQDTLHDEQRIMKGINHENVIRIFEIQENEEELTLVLEMARGGELFEKIVEIGKYPEDRARTIFMQLLAAIEYLHQNRIAHRDLKPENILLMDKDSDVVKIADFGLSRMCGGDSSMLQTVCGTPQYLAPEILENQDGRSGYGFEVDYWSLGVILYILLSGCPPFHDERKLPVLEQVKQASYNFPRKAWKGVSLEAMDLVKWLIHKDAKKRYQAEQIRQHPWITGRPMPVPAPSVLGPRQREHMQNASADSDLPMPSAKRSRIFPAPIQTSAAPTHYGPARPRPGFNKQHLGVPGNPHEQAVNLHDQGVTPMSIS